MHFNADIAISCTKLLMYTIEQTGVYRNWGGGGMKWNSGVMYTVHILHHATVKAHVQAHACAHALLLPAGPDTILWSIYS